LPVSGIFSVLFWAPTKSSNKTAQNNATKTPRACERNFFKHREPPVATHARAVRRTAKEEPILDAGDGAWRCLTGLRGSRVSVSKRFAWKNARVFLARHWAIALRGHLKHQTKLTPKSLCAVNFAACEPPSASRISEDIQRSALFSALSANSTRPGIGPQRFLLRDPSIDILLK
jgi:hypothetical protein